MRAIRLFLLIFSMPLCCSCAKDIVDLTGNISGTVKDFSGGQFIENCKVSLSPGGKSTTTASNGAYEFNDLQPGDYTLSFSKAGYNDESTSVAVVAGQTANVSAMLKAKSAFALSETVLDFGDLESSKIFYAFNNSDADCSFTISNSPSWLSLSQERGIVKAGSSESISATIDRNSVGYGDFSQTLNISYSGKTAGSVSLIVRFTKVQLTAPKVSIADKAENITQNSFDIKGTIEATGGSPVTSYGHCWSTSANPTVSDNRTTLGSTTSTGPFTSNITNLATFTTYYVRAYATNDQGTTYSQQISVTTQDVESDKWDGEIAKSFAGGKGTSIDPYIIKTGGQLLLIKDYKDKHFELGGNINLDNHNWPPIKDFSGSIDGKGFIISNLKIDRTEDNIGLFASVIGDAVLKNITINNVSISSPESSYVGALVGNVSNGSNIIIDNCSVVLSNESIIYGKSCVGGIVGYCSIWDRLNPKSVLVTNSTVTSSAEDYAILGIEKVGGIIGEGDGCVACKSNVNVKAEKQGGGIIGCLYQRINSCQYKGKICGDKLLGGIVGCTHALLDYRAEPIGPVVESCSAHVDLFVSIQSAGGVVGYADKGTKVITCYSTGTIESQNRNENNLGGIIGEKNDERNRCCYIYHSYSCIDSVLDNFYGLCGCLCDIYDSATISGRISKDENHTINNCVASCTDITSFMKSCYSEYEANWKFNDSWTWEGVIDSKKVMVSCPKLAWE